ncbi:hypothetical protein M758_3G030400 [Ceratodon purpureus]|nr:hypothetical protein M758_3G030400 [Ceratodon purpureus]
MAAAAGTSTVMTVLRGRWFVLAIGVVVLVVSAGAYSFSVYSQKLKHALDINQENLNLIANFKDLGVNFGLFSGLLYDYWSPGGVLFLGAVETAAGYSLAWLSVRKQIPASLWSMCLFQLVGANSQAMLNTAVLVHCVHLFPASKGAVIGLLKGYIGVSGAILIQIYTTICGVGKPEAFLLMLVWLPSSVALLSIFVFRRPVTPFRGIPDSKYIYWLLALGFALAFYLMGVSLTRNLATLSASNERVIGAVLMVLIFVPLMAITYRSEIYGKKSEEEHLDSTTTYGNADQIASAGLYQNEALYVTSKAETENLKPNETISGSSIVSESNKLKEFKSVTVTSIGCKTQSEALDDLTCTRPSSSEPQDHVKPWPRKGDDHTILQTFRSLDFWLLFIATTFGIGSGLTVTDNMGQLGLSLGYSASAVRTFVSLVSIWNAIGRWVGGFVSDILLRHYGTSRPLFLAVMMTLMAMAFLLIAMAVPGCLYFGSIFLGLSFGAQYPLYATIVADIFGLKYYATLYSSIGMASPIGMYVLSVPVVGRFYDSEAKRKSNGTASNASDSSLECLGSSCFGRSLLVLMGVTLGAAGCAVALWFRTRNLYRESHEEYQQAVRKSKSSTEAELAARGGV